MSEASYDEAAEAVERERPVRIELGLLGGQIEKLDTLVHRLVLQIGPVSRPGSEDDKLIGGSTIEAVPEHPRSEIALIVQAARERLTQTTWAVDDALSRVEV